MAQHHTDEPNGDEPLDPAAERVRRKLVRFAGINLALLFAAVMAVLAAVVYKSMGTRPEPGAPAALAEEEKLGGDITIPPGARVLSQALSGNILSLHIGLAGGGEAIFVYDLSQARLLGRFDIAEEAP